jgi:hypothetical protein
MAVIDILQDRSTEKILRSIKPEVVEAYVISKGNYFKDFKDGITSIYRDKGDKNFQIKIPLQPEYSDYSLLLSDTIKSIATIEKRNVWEIITNLKTEHPSDILRYQLKGSDTDDGTAPLRSGANLYSGAKDTLEASAYSIEKPESIRYNHLKSVSDLVERCRIGQTEYGSYSVPLICPLFKKEKETVTYIQWNENPEITFTRRVTINLMESLHHIVDSISKEDTERLISPSREDIKINPKMFEALNEMEPKKKNLDLNISSDWLIVPPTEKIPNSVSVNADYFKEIKDISDALIPKEESDMQDFVGRVHLLKDDLTSLKKIKNQIKVSTFTPSGQPIHAKIVLNEFDYQNASLAHTQKKAVIVKGVLKKLKRDYQIVDIEKFELTK